MTFSTGELTNITNAALDYYINKGTVYSSTLADKPLLAAIDKGAATFPGGKENVSLAVKGIYSAVVTGYTHTDPVAYVNPANIERVLYPWREHHTGISVTLTELKKDGISVNDSLDGKSTSKHSGRETTALANLLEDKLEDMLEGYSRGMNTLLYDDGTTDVKGFAGIRSFIKDNPAATSATVGTLRTDTNTWWRNRYNVAFNAGTTDLVEFIHTEIRQLRRYGGKPNIAVCGSAFLDKLVSVLHASGNYTQSGWNSSGSMDIAFADVKYQGIPFVYDPALDDLTISGKDPDKRCYIIDTSKLRMHYMEGEKMKRHSPARLHTSYEMHRALTTTCVLCANQLNCHGVYEIT